MNTRDAALVAGGASVGALISFALTRRHYVKALDELAETIDDYFAKEREEKTVEETPVEITSEPAEPELETTEEAPKRVIVPVEESSWVQPSNDISEEEDEEEDEEEIPDEPNYSGERFEIADEDTFYLLQGYSQGEVWYDRDGDELYTSDGVPDSNAWQEIKESEYGFSKWPLQSLRVDQTFTVLDNHDMIKLLVHVPERFNIDEIG